MKWGGWFLAGALAAFLAVAVLAGARAIERGLERPRIALGPR